MKKHYETHVEDTDKLISVAGPVLDYKSWYEQYRKLMEEQAQRKYGLYTPTSEGDDDDFPSITGMIARYSALGLTNEQMAANPVWVDKTGNGRDLQLKNFSWKRMSGVGGYVADIDEWGTNSTAAYFERNSIKITATFKENASLGLLYHNIKLRQSCVLKVTGIPEGCDAFLDDRLGNRFYMSEDGVYEIIPSNFLAEALYLSIEKYPERWYGSKLTIEQLPLYPGFILGDGVDDFAVTEKELNFEDTYTVYTAFIPFQSNPLRNMILCGADSKKTFSMQYSSLVYVSFIAGNNYYINADFVNGLNLFACKRNGNNICIKNLLTNKVVTGTCGDWVENAGLYYLWKNATYISFAKAAIAGQTICNGYYSTDEDDEKVLNWYKKQYPWLFPDQAWTTVGKTNEDEDRATIANITGNGNDLVLSNVAFSENSGYGSYPFGMNVWNPDYIADQPYGTVHYPNDSKSYATTVKNNATNFRIKFRLRGLPEGGSFLIRAFDMNDLNTVLKTYTYTENGIHEFVYNDPNKPARIILYNGNTPSNISEFYLDIIPEYEGYLVTDGVDDSGRVVGLTISKDFTLVGEWILFSKTSVNAGLSIHPQIHIFNRPEAIQIMFRTAGKTLPVKSLKAICSDGRCYDENWSELKINVGEFTDNKGTLFVASNGTNYAQIAFKNLGIYDNQILSKDDCIKAYNYLQTLKSK